MGICCNFEWDIFYVGMTYTMNDIAYLGNVAESYIDPGERNWLVSNRTGEFLSVSDSFLLQVCSPDMVAGNALWHIGRLRL